MKIEIELEEVESLRKRNEFQEKEIKTLEEKLKSIDEKGLKKKAVDLSKWLFDNYMQCVFKGLGFERNWQRKSVHFNDYLEDKLGKDWYDSERIKVEIGATVTTSFREAFLTIGIISNSEKKEEELEWVSD